MSTVVRTADGQVRGVERDGVVAFRGIPYAASPFGEFRFRAPRPAPRWDGVRDAARSGPTAPQPARAGNLPGINMAPVLGRWVGGEEYLTVNVWTPDLGAGGLPVMVFLHGGAFVSGSGSLPLYDGSRFATQGVVLVTVNYRLGAEGFLPLPGGDRNVGLHDQIAALHWVQENITAFGGDPTRVTVFGESAGAISIACLLGAPAAKGLFSRAILQSGNTYVHSSEYGSRQAKALAGLLDVPTTREGFALLDPADLLNGQTRLEQDPGSIDLTGLPESSATITLPVYGPTLDADIVPAEPLEAVADGAAAGIDLLAGTNTNEINLWLVPTGLMAAMTEESLGHMLAAEHPSPATLIAAYRQADPGASAGQLYAAIMTDRAFRRPTLQLLDRHAAAGGNCFGYEFTEPSPALDGTLGACHTLELPHVFGNLRVDGLGGSEGLLGNEPSAELAERIQRAWVQFASTGHAGWKPYTAEERSVMKIGRGPWALATDTFGPLRDAW